MAYCKAHESLVEAWEPLSNGAIFKHAELPGWLKNTKNGRANCFALDYPDRDRAAAEIRLLAFGS